MESNNRNIRKEIEEKLNDEVLRGALGRFAEAYPTARAKAYENVEDIDALREQFKNMKINTVAHLEEVADKFEAEATKRGAHVFRANRRRTAQSDTEVDVSGQRGRVLSLAQVARDDAADGGISDYGNGQRPGFSWHVRAVGGAWRYSDGGVRRFFPDLPPSEKAAHVASGYS